MIKKPPSPSLKRLEGNRAFRLCVVAYLSAMHVYNVTDRELRIIDACNRDGMPIEMTAKFIRILRTVRLG